MSSPNPYQLELSASQAKSRLLKARKETFDWLIAHGFDFRTSKAIVDHIELEASQVTAELTQAEAREFHRLFRRVTRHYAAWYRLTYGKGGSYV